MRPALGLLLLVAGSHASCPDQCLCQTVERTVDCSGLSLTQLPANLSLHTVELDLSANNLSSLDGLPQLTPHLRRLFLTGNRFSQLPHGVLEALLSLEYLHLGDNLLEEIDLTGLPVLRRIEHVDLSGNRIKEWPMVEPGPDQPALIQYLSLADNRVSVLVPQQFSTLSSLTQLSISKNKLRHINRDAFQNLTNLRSLDLSRNRLKKFEPVTFRELNNLRDLRVNRNALRNLEDGTFHGANALQSLNLSNNKLSRVEKGWLFGLSSLQTLDLRHNQLVSIDADAWRQCTRLLRLDLSDNLFDSLDEAAFAELGELQSLSINGCRLQLLHNRTFVGLRSLKTLSLASNQLSICVEDSEVRPLHHLSQLQALSLADNQLKRLPPHTFSALDALRSLDLTDNPLNTIAENAFNPRTLRQIQFNSHAFLCDCQLAWFVGWLSDHKYLSESAADNTCVFPEYLSGSFLFELKADQLSCNMSDAWPQPVLVSSPEEHQLLLGDSVTLSCVVQHRPAVNVHVQWKHKAKLLSSSLEYLPESVALTTASTKHDNQTMQLTAQLHIQRAQRLGSAWEHQGNYQCIVQNDYGTVYSRPAKLLVHVEPTFTLRPSNMSLRVGQTARIECAADGSPQPILSWQKDGGSDFPAARERRMHVLQAEDQDVFFVVNVQSRDAGLYSCTATNEAGSVTASAHLTVLQEPSFRKPLKDKEVQVGQTIVLECLADGAPPPNIQWYRGGLQLPRSQRYTFTGDKQLLVIVQVRPNDAGLYECHISNSLGANAQSAYLSVFTQLDSAKQGNMTEGDVFFEDDSGEHVQGVLGVRTSTVVLCVAAALVLCCFGTSMLWLCVIWCKLKPADPQAKQHNTPVPGVRPHKLRTLVSLDEADLTAASDGVFDISGPVGGQRVLNMLDYYTQQHACSFDTFGQQQQPSMGAGSRREPVTLSTSTSLQPADTSTSYELQGLISSSLDSGVNEHAMTVSNSTT